MGHLSFARRGFRAQVPRTFGTDDVVLMSGVVELGLGAASFTAVHPGDPSQPLLVAWALRSTGST